MSKDKNISKAVADGAGWMLLLRMSLRGLGLISTVALARLLTPEDFGIVAIAMSFFALLLLTAEFGFDTVIIQMQNPSKDHYDTAWTFNLMFGAGLALLFIVLSGTIATLYETPSLQPLICAIAILFIIGGLESIGTLDFRKNLTFEKEFKLKILPKLVGVPVTIFFAFTLRNYWALAIGTIVTQFVSLGMGYLMHDYRPRFTLVAARELFNFSRWLMINNLISFVSNRSPELFIGKILNPQAAGLFSVSNEIAMMATAEVSAAVSRASYPGYAKVAHDSSHLTRLYLDVTGSSALILFPAAVGLYAIAGLFVPVLLGAQWLEAIPILKIIAIGGLLMALSSNALYIFMAIGEPRTTAMIGIARVMIFLPLLVLFVNLQGLAGAAMAILVASIIMFFVTIFFVMSRLKLSIMELVRILYRPFIAVLIMNYAIENILGYRVETGIVQQAVFLVITVALGALVYFVAIYVLWKLAGKPPGFEDKIISLLRLKKIHFRTG